MQIMLNFTSLLGVIFFDWSVFSLFYFFFLETVALSFFDGIKIFFAQGDENKGPHFGKAIRFMLFRAFILAFYLIFILSFVGVLISGKQGKGYEWIEYFLLLKTSFRITVFTLLFIQLFELVYFYFIKNQRKTTKVESLYFLFSPRIIIIHVVIILGSFSFEYFEGRFGARYGLIGFAAVFVVFKTIVDFFVNHFSSLKLNENQF